jgi:hypothetical protein
MAGILRPRQRHDNNIYHDNSSNYRRMRELGDDIARKERRVVESRVASTASMQRGGGRVYNGGVTGIGGRRDDDAASYGGNGTGAGAGALSFYKSNRSDYQRNKALSASSFTLSGVLSHSHAHGGGSPHSSHISHSPPANCARFSNNSYGGGGGGRGGGGGGGDYRQQQRHYRPF